jgi:hypothetical protein
MKTTNTPEVSNLAKCYGVTFISRKDGRLRFEWYATEYEQITAWSIMSKTHAGVEKLVLA